MSLRPSVLVGVLLLAGCAGGMREAPAPLGPPNLLLSPSGEPFRRGPQSADPVDAWFTGADADRDGRLTATEMIADALRFFKVLDQNGDGRIDAFESQRYEREIVPEFGMDPFGARAAAAISPESRAGGPPDDIIRLPDRGRPPPRGGRRAAAAGGGWGGRTASLTGDPQPVRAADTDLSQSVTQAEFGALAGRHFVRLDIDRDGAVTRIELPPPKPLVEAGMAAPRGRGGPPRGR